MRQFFRVASLTLATMLMMPGCGSGTVITEDGRGIQFRSGDFELVGDLQLPDGTQPYPVVVMVHGDGGQSRTGNGAYSPIMERFLNAGYAVFSWDKPGTGDSTGEFDEGETLRQRAAILADGIAVLAEHSAIDGGRIGLWGISQAGWVMPLALELTDDVAFMMVVSGGGEDSIEQLGYQIGQRLVCNGLTAEKGQMVADYFPLAAKGPTYEVYTEAMKVLVEIEGWKSFVGPEIRTEEQWQPWPAEIDAYFDPMTVIEHTTIPVLAVFGEMDRYVDPVQGADAYQSALQRAGNTNYRVETIPGVSHVITPATTGCPGEGAGGSYAPHYLDLMTDWLIGLAKS